MHQPYQPYQRKEIRIGRRTFSLHSDGTEATAVALLEDSAQSLQSIKWLLFTVVGLLSFLLLLVMAVASLYFDAQGCAPVKPQLQPRSQSEPHPSHLFQRI